MKKSIIALAVAGALTAPMVAQADATLYGSLRLVLTNSGSELNFDDNLSRIGIKGSSELFSGAKAIFQFEQGVNPAIGGWKSEGVTAEDKEHTGGRLASVGVTGDFGTVNAGRQWSPFALWTVLPFHTGENSASTRTAGYITGVGALFHRLSNTLAYVTPNMNGLQAAAVMIADGEGSGEDLDAYNLAAKYSAGGLMVSGSVIQVDGLNGTAVDVQHLSVGATYKMDALYVGARYAETDDAGDETDQFSVVGKYTMGNTSLMASYSDTEAELDVYSVEVQQKLGKQAKVFAAYTDRDDGTDGVEVGYRVDF